MAICIDTADPTGVRVVCRTDWWERHIVAGHPEMADRLDWVRDTVHGPLGIYQSDTHANRRVFYQPYAFPGWQWPCFLRVVVAYDQNRLTRRLSGTIITAFPSTGPKPTEVLLWPS